MTLRADLYKDKVIAAEFIRQCVRNMTRFFKKLCGFSFFKVSADKKTAEYMFLGNIFN